MDAASLALVCVAFAVGGVIKGATGAGAPLLAVPLMAALRDVPFAVAVFVLPNIVPNVWQYQQYRHAITVPRFVWAFALSGGLGVALGTVLLASWRPDVLQVTVALVVAAYILFRLAKPAWRLPYAMAARLVVPVGIVAGILQGASGLSAPVSLSFLNAVRFDRAAFIATIALFFAALGVVQLPVQIAYGIMTLDRFILSPLSLVPLIAFMPVGAWLARRASPQVFDRVILGVLAVLAVKLGVDGLF